jgi:6-phosphogluconolactonase (cycloisomerase 2 family)
MFDLSRPCFTASSFLVNKQILNRLGRVVLAIAAIVWTGVCAPMSATAQTSQFGHFVYKAGTPYGGSSEQFIYGYSINGASGALTSIPSTPISAGDSVVVMAAHPSGNFVYALTAGAGSHVAAFSVDAVTGGLTPVSGSPYAAGPSSGYPDGAPAYPLLQMDPSGKFLFVANGTSGQIEEFSVNATTGALTLLSQTPLRYASGLRRDRLADTSTRMATTQLWSTRSIQPAGR